MLENVDEFLIFRHYHTKKIESQSSVSDFCTEEKAFLFSTQDSKYVHCSI